MRYYFTQTIITNILIVFKKSFKSKKEAEEWDETTKICPNFTLLSVKEIEAWEGEVIHVPQSQKRKKNNVSTR